MDLPSEHHALIRLTADGLTMCAFS